MKIELQQQLATLTDVTFLVVISTVLISTRTRAGTVYNVVGGGLVGGSYEPTINAHDGTQWRVRHDPRQSSPTISALRLPVPRAHEWTAQRRSKWRSLLMDLAVTSDVHVSSRPTNALPGRVTEGRQRYASFLDNTPSRCGTKGKSLFVRGRRSHPRLFSQLSDSTTFFSVRIDRGT